MLYIPGEAAAAALKTSVEEAETFLTAAGTQHVYFETSRASADAEIAPARYLEALKLYLENNPEAKVTVTGHSDDPGPADFNMMLSELRARFVTAHVQAEKAFWEHFSAALPAGDSFE